MKDKIISVYYPSEIADDNVVRATITLEFCGETLYTHCECVYKGLNCIGNIFGYKDTDVQGDDREAALEAIAGIDEILVNEYGIVIPEDTNPDIVPPINEESNE